MVKRKKKMLRHPWDKWFRKSRFVLHRGTDYSCQPHSMGVQVRSAAQKRELVVCVSIDEGTIAVEVFR